MRQLFDGLGCCVQAVFAHQVELIGIREACQIISHQQLSSVIIESDCKVVVDFLSSNLDLLWSCAVLIDNIKDIASQFSTVFTCVPRCYNAPVH